MIAKVDPQCGHHPPVIVKVDLQHVTMVNRQHCSGSPPATQDPSPCLQACLTLRGTDPLARGSASALNTMVLLNSDGHELFRPPVQQLHTLRSGSLSFLVVLS